MADYDPTSDVGRVRLLLNDTDPTNQVFSDGEIQTFLDLEDGAVKYAAALAIDTNAGNEVLTSKVITTRDGSVNGAAVAAAMHGLAESLRVSAESGDGFYFDVIDLDPILIIDPDFPDRSWVI